MIRKPWSAVGIGWTTRKRRVIPSPRTFSARLLRLLAERLSELQQKLPLVKVVLFGSYAKGNYAAGSDVDVLIRGRTPRSLEDLGADDQRRDRSLFVAIPVD